MTEIENSKHVEAVFCNVSTALDKMALITGTQDERPHWLKGTDPVIIVTVDRTALEQVASFRDFSLNYKTIPLLEHTDDDVIITVYPARKDTVDKMIDSGLVKEPHAARLYADICALTVSRDGGKNTL